MDDKGQSLVETAAVPIWADSAPSIVMSWKKVDHSRVKAWLDETITFAELASGGDGGTDLTEGPFCLLDADLPTFAIICDSREGNTEDVSMVRLTDPPAFPEVEDQALTELQKVMVLVVGAGALGSHLSRALLDWGIRRFIIVDRDWLEVENLRLHACDSRWVGAPKATALSGDLRQRVAGLTTHNFKWDVVSEADGMRDLIQMCDLVAVAVDDPIARASANHSAVSLGTPAVFAALFRSGTIGESFAFVPGGPCLQCSRLILPIEAAVGPVTSPSAYRRGLLSSLCATAAMAAAMCISVLAPDAPGAGPLQAPLALWSPVRQTDLDAPYHFTLPNQTTWVPMRATVECAVCGGRRSVADAAEHERALQRLGLPGVSSGGDSD
jgi:molybdopterin/thiamine biosynthesis adenylyltransferase